MEFVWDPLKNVGNIEDHQVDFGTAAAIFEDNVLTRIDGRRDYGETRYVSIGFVEDDCYVVVWTPRGIGSSRRGKEGAMNDEHIVRYTLDEIIEKNRRGEFYHNPDAPEGPSLGKDFWKDAVLQEPPKPTTIVLPVERAMMEWFKAEYEDYPSRMNEILRQHMAAAQRKKAS